MISALFILLLAALFWDTLILGSSLPLFFLTMLAGGIGCMSDVTYWAYVMSQPPQCTKAMSVGMSVGGLATVAVTAAQLNGRPAEFPRFDAQSFFIFATMIQILSFFVVLAVDGTLLPAIVQFS